MDWWLTAGIERFWLWRGGAPPGAGEELRVRDKVEARQILAPCVRDTRSMATLRAALADTRVPPWVNTLTDQQVLREVELRLLEGRLHLGRWKRENGWTGATSAGAGAGAGRAGGSSAGAGGGPTGGGGPGDTAFRGVPVGDEPAPRREIVGERPPTRSYRPAAAPVAGTPTPPTDAQPVAAPLSWYEVVLMDELEAGIAGVPIELSTPGGAFTLETDGSGAVRVDQIPPGTATARIAGPTQLAQAVRDRVEWPKRNVPPPDVPDLLVLTPARLGTTVSFPDAHTQRVMIVARADVVWGSAREHWATFQLLSDETEPCRLENGEEGSTLRLCSTGTGPRAVLGTPALMPLEPPEPAPVPPPLPNVLWIPPDTYIWQPGDTLPDVAYNYLGDGGRWGDVWALNEAFYPDREPGALEPGEELLMPPGSMPVWAGGDMPVAEGPAAEAAPEPWRLRVDVDALHEALFAKDFAAVEAVVTDAFLAAPSSPAADWPQPLAESVQFASEMTYLALRGYVDPPLVLEYDR